MENKALYRIHRPSTFDEVVGQEVIVNTLMNAIKHNKTTHSYLFCGPRGTGKTSLARIFAKTINCISPIDGNPCNECASCNGINRNQELDIIEMDAASNRGVDDIREIIATSYTPPSMIKNKVYIIDEVHMLTTTAFNALLKTLEEPPANVVFILATTNPQKLPNTILSRCQRYDFQRIKDNDLSNLLINITNKSERSITPDASMTIAKLAKGGARDALSMLDQLFSFSDNITSESVMELLGSVSVTHIVDLFVDLKKPEVLLNKIEHFKNTGVNPAALCDSMINVLRDVIVFINLENDSMCKYLNHDEVMKLIKFNGDMNYYNELVEFVLECKRNLKYADNSWEVIELFLLKSSNMEIINKEKINYSKVVMVETQVQHVATQQVVQPQAVVQQEVQPEPIQEHIEPVQEEVEYRTEEEVNEPVEALQEQVVEEVEQVQQVEINNDINDSPQMEEENYVEEVTVQEEQPKYIGDQPSLFDNDDSVHSQLDQIDEPRSKEDTLLSTGPIAKSTVISTSVLRGTKYNADDDGIVRIGVEEKFHVDNITHTSLEQTAVLEVKKPEVKEESFAIKDEITLDPNDAVSVNYKDALNYILQSDKAMLNDIKDRWHVINQYKLHPKTSKVATLLAKGKPVVACEHGLILTYEHVPDANVMTNNNRDVNVLAFIKELFGSRLVVLGVHTDDWTAIKGDYLMLRQANKLPKPTPIVLPEIKQESNENQYVNNIKDIFGNIVEEK